MRIFNVSGKRRRRRRRENCTEKTVHFDNLVKRRDNVEKQAETTYTFAQRAKSRSHNRYRVPTVGMKSVGQSVELPTKSDRQSVEPPKKSSGRRYKFYKPQKTIIMLQYSNLDSVTQTSNRFKNEANLKVFSKLSKVAMIAIMAMSIACIANAQTKHNTRQVEEKVQKSEKEALNTEIEALKAYIASEKVEMEHLQSSLEHLHAVHHSKQICRLMKKVEKYRQNAERRISNWEREISHLEREKQRLEIAMRSE